MALALSSSSLDQSSTVSSHVDKKKNNGKSKKKKDKKEKKQKLSALDGAHSKRTPGKPKFPCNLFKGDRLLKECPGLSLVQQEWSKRSKLSMSSTSDHHVDNTPSTSEPLVKVCKGKVLYTCLICKAMHRTFICPSMDEASRWLENITNHQQVIPRSDSNLSLDSSLVD